MLNIVIWTARNKSKVILPRNVEREEESSNVVSGILLSELNLVVFSGLIFL